MPHQNDLDEYYKKLFENDYVVVNNEYDNKTDRVKNALDKAWETRNFEIKLYWQRALYFWGFNATMIALIGFFKTNDKFITEFISLLGFVFSVGWIMSNHGSKFWQKNWEKHINYLEDNYYGKIYKKVHPDLKKRLVPSISKVNLLVSYFMGISWLIFYFYIVGFIHLFTIENNTLIIYLSVLWPALILSVFTIFAVRKK